MGARFDDWVYNGLVRFLFGFGVEVEKSSIFSLILQNQISGERGPGIGWEEKKKLEIGKRKI